jgi:subtilisin family serine protease
VEIAVIDTGISLNYFDNVDSLASNLNFTNVNDIKEDMIPNNVITHGTICASIIKTYTQKAIIHSLNVFENGIGIMAGIVAAINYCVQNKIKIINISFGTNCIQNDNLLEKAVNFAHDNGNIIVASVSKNGIVTYPAHYDKVISVGVKNELHLGKNKIVVNKNPISSIEVFACGIQRLYKNRKLIYITRNEPSYATAVVTAEICNILCNLGEDATKREILDALSGI